jgi:hypothetical protein
MIGYDIPPDERDYDEEDRIELEKDRKADDDFERKRMEQFEKNLVTPDIDLMDFVEQPKIVK